MRFYPDIPNRRAVTLLTDLALVLMLVLFGWLGLQVHDAVDRLAVLGEGVRSTGTAVRDGFDSAADAVDGVPLVCDAYGTIPLPTRADFAVRLAVGRRSGLPSLGEAKKKTPGNAKSYSPNGLYGFDPVETRTLFVSR